MNRITAATLPERNETFPADATSRLTSSLRRWTRTLFAAAVLAGIAALGSLAIGLFSFWGIGMTTAAATAGTLLIFSAFALLAAVAHCIDKVSEIETAMRREYCRQHGLGEWSSN